MKCWRWSLAGRPVCRPIGPDTCIRPHAETSRSVHSDTLLLVIADNGLMEPTRGLEPLIRGLQGMRGEFAIARDYPLSPEKSLVMCRSVHHGSDEAIWVGVATEPHPIEVTTSPAPATEAVTQTAFTKQRGWP